MGRLKGNSSFTGYVFFSCKLNSLAVRISYSFESTLYVADVMVLKGRESMTPGLLFTSQQAVEKERPKV